MSNRKTLEQKIAQAQAEIEQRENRLKELKKMQTDKERKERTHRLCKRGAVLEKYLPDSIPLTDEQFQAFVEEAAANDFGRRKLAYIISQGPDKYLPKSAEKATQQGSTVAAETGVAALPQNNFNTAKSATVKRSTNAAPQTAAATS